MGQHLRGKAGIHTVAKGLRQHTQPEHKEEWWLYVGEPGRFHLNQVTEVIIQSYKAEWCWVPLVGATEKGMLPLWYSYPKHTTLLSAWENRLVLTEECSSHHEGSIFQECAGCERQGITKARPETGKEWGNVTTKHNMGSCTGSWHLKKVTNKIVPWNQSRICSFLIVLYSSIGKFNLLDFGGCPTVM